MGYSVEDALEERRKKRGKTSFSVESALEDRKKKKSANSGSIKNDIIGQYNSIVNSYTSADVWGETAKSSYNEQRDNHIATTNLKRKVEANRKYLGDEVADRLLGNLEAVGNGYQGLYARSQYNSEYDYNTYVMNDPNAERDSDSIANRKKLYNANTARIKELDEEIASLEPKRNILGGEETGGWNSSWAGVKSDNDKKLEALKAEREKLQAQNRIYEHGNQYIDDTTTELVGREDFEEVSANRNFTNPTKEDMDKYDLATDSSSWRTDADGNYYDAFGTKIDLNNTDENGRVIHPSEGSVEISDPLGLYLSATDEDVKEAVGIESSVGSTTWATAIMDGEDGSWNQLTENEIGYYYYLLNAEGKDAAVEFLSNMKTELNRRSTIEYNADLSKAFDEANALEKIALSIATIPAQAVGNVAGGIEDAVNLVTGNDINPYSSAHAGQNFSQTTRGLQAEELTERNNGASIPLLDFNLGDAYQAVMSVGDQLTALAVGSTGYGVSMGLGAFSSTAKDLYEQGASNAEILGVSAVSGIAEGFFEKYSIDKLIKIGDSKTIGQIFKNLLIQGGIEASEEVATETANFIADTVIRQGASNWDKLLEKHNGNELAAMGEELQQIGKAGLSGFIAGAIGGGAVSTASYVQNQAAYTEHGQNIIDRGGVDPLKALALEKAGVSQKSLDKIQSGKYTGKNALGKMVASVKNAKNANAVGKLSEKVDTERVKQNKADIQSALVEKGIDKKTAKHYADILVEMNEEYYNGGKSSLELGTAEQWRAITGNDNAYSVMREVVTDPESAINKRNAQHKLGRMGMRITDDGDIVPNSVKADDLSASEGYVSPVAKVVTEGKFDASAEGLAIDTKTNKEISIKKIASVEKGKVVFELEDGGTVAAENVSYASENDAIIYEAVATMASQYDFDANTANALVNNFKAYEGVDISAKEYALAIDEAYRYGRFGYTMDELANDGKFANKLTSVQRESIYNEGTQARKAVSQKEGAKFASEKGEVHIDRTTEKKLSKLQQESLEGVKIISKVLQKDIYVFESYVKGEKRYMVDRYGNEVEADNGMYYGKDGAVYIDLFAGADAKGTMMYTLAHELTHHVEKVSPAQFERLANFLNKHYGKKGVSVDAAVHRIMEDSARGLTYKQAYSEFVAQNMESLLTDGKVAEKLVEMRKTDKGLFNTIKKFFDNLAKRFEAILTEYHGMEHNLTPEGMFISQSAEAVRELQQIFAEALFSTSENAMSAEEAKAVDAFGEDLGTVETNKDGELLVATNEDNSTLVYSERTWKNGGKAKFIKVMQAMGYENAETYAKYLDDTLDYLHELAVMYEKLDQHLDADITTDLKNGKQTLYAIVNNGDYPVNIDLALICKKRVAYMRLMAKMIEDGMFGDVKYDGDAIAEVNRILRKNGFETACLGCFVESRRLQFQTWAETIVQEWNEAVEAHSENASYFRFADGKANLTDAEIDMLVQELENGGKKNAKGNLNLGKGSVAEKMGRLLDKVPSLAKKLTVDDLLTPQGLTALRSTDDNLFSLVKQRYGAASPKIVQEFNPYNSEIADLSFNLVKQITGNSVKGGQDYLREAKKELGSAPKKKKGESAEDFKARKDEYNLKAETLAMRKYLYDIGGARIQSFSDFMIENVFDYLQIFADLSAKALPMHGYTKEISCLRLFGMTGAKWNGSLIAHVEKSMGKEYAGLLPASEAKNGILVKVDGKDYCIGFDDYARNKATNGESFIQSIGMKDIVALMYDPRYSPYVGNITIGVSDKQILAMLDSPLFRMVIPYHASGMLPQFAKLVGVDMYNDYTNYQNTTVREIRDLNGNILTNAEGKPSIIGKNGKEIKIDTHYAFNEMLQKYGDAKKTADDYIAWCKMEHPIYDGKEKVGYATFNPKFSDSPYGTDFTKHPNYYKLLEDFNVYDNVTEESAQQGEVTMTFPSEENRLTAEQKVAYENALRGTGIFTEAEIKKYLDKADMTFEEIVRAEVGNRVAYETEQEPKWEATVKEIEDTLLKNHRRTSSANTAVEYIEGKNKGISLKPKTGSYLAELSDADVQWSERKTNPPTKTIKGYKVFFVKNGKLYPPMVANPNGEGTPRGVWLDADDGELARNKDGSVKTNSFGRPRVKAGGKGTQGGSGDLAYRPGWHLGDLPLAKQFARKDADGNKSLFPEAFVWAECDVAADVEYQAEADAMGYKFSKNGKYNHQQASLDHMPREADGTAGYYRYRTNPDPTTEAWIITGAMKVNRLLTDEEVNAILEENGKTPMPRQGGKLNLAKLGLTEEDFSDDVQYSSRKSRKPLEVRKKSYYNDFATNAMKWAYKADTKSGDVNVIYDSKRRKYILLEALEEGYFEVTSGTYEEMRGLYEQAHRGTDSEIYEDSHQTRSNRGADLWDLQFPKDRGYDDRDDRPLGGEGLQGDTAGSNEHLRSGNQGEYVEYSERRKAPTFYSKMGKVVEGIKTEKIGANGVVSYLKGKGVKDEEIKWSGIQAFLDGKKSVTKAELQEFIAGSTLQIGEKTLRLNNGAYMDLDSLWQQYFDKPLEDSFDVEQVDKFDSMAVKVELAYYEESGYDMPPQDVQDHMAELADRIGSPTKWHDYTVDGGENYRELLFRMPNSDYSNTAMDTHWGAKGVLAHARIQDFYDTDGNKILFIEEIQSDWHNEGHKNGYVNRAELERKLDDAREKAINARNKAINYLLDASNNGYNQDEYQRLHDEAEALDAEETRLHKEWFSAKGIPDAPFRETYHEYVLKRLLRMAAEEGYDKIGWTTADMQSKRWSSQYAEGYRIEYDQDIPKFLNKYGKQWGARVGSTELPYSGETIYTTEEGAHPSSIREWVDDMRPLLGMIYGDDVKRRLTVHQKDDILSLMDKETGEVYATLREQKSAEKVWSFDINDSMRESVLFEGQPMYSERNNKMSNRAMLANALESVAKNSDEQQILQEYKAVIDKADELESHLTEVNAEIKQLSFSEGTRNDARLRVLREDKTKTENRINTIDRRLLRLEANDSLRKLLNRERKKAYDKALQQGREAVKRVRDEKNTKLDATVKKYQESRKKAVEGRNKTAMRNKLKKVIKDLNSILNNGTKERNVKLGLQDTVRKALEASEVLFNDEITNEDIVGLGVDSVTEAELEMLQQYANLLDKRDSLKDSINDLTTDTEEELEQRREYLGDLRKTDNAISQLNKDLKDVFVRERARLNRASVTDALNALANAYAALGQSNDDYIKNNSYVVGMHDRITALSKDLDGVTVKDMTLDQLQSVYDAYKMVKHMVTTANNLFREGRAESLAEIIGSVQGQMLDRLKKNRKDRSEIVESIANGIRSFTWNELKPVYAFERIGSEALTELYWDAVYAENVWAKDVTDAKSFLDSQKEKFHHEEWDLETVHTFKLHDGRDFKVNLSDMMSIYAYSRREQAYEHMTEGGFVHDRGSTYKEKGIRKKHIRLTETSLMTESLIQEICFDEDNGLTKEQRDYVEAVQSYLTTLGEKGNEVSNVLFGIDLFKEKVYFPLKSESDYRSSVEEALNATQTAVSLKNTGVSKQTVPHASNPIVLQGFDEVVNEHIDTMAKYHAFVLPIENLQRVFNNVSRDGGYGSTKTLLESVYGEAAKKYLDQYITDLNGGVQVGGYNGPMGMFAKFKKTAVGASLSVVVQQYFAVVRAMEVVAPKYFVPFLNGEASKADEKQWEELKKYAGVAVIKEIGGFDVGSARSTKDYIGIKNYHGKNKVKGFFKDPNYRSKVADDAMMWGAAKMDEIGWSTIWRAVKKEVADKGGLVPGTEEFLQECGKRFTEVVTYTQVYDSVNSRSGMMRSKHDLVKFATSFMGEPTTAVNMAYKSLLNVARAEKGERAKAIGHLAGRTMPVLLFSTILTALAKSVIYANRDDEEDESWTEKWMRRFGQSMASDLNPLNYFPFLRDVMSVIEGWDVERPDMTLIANVITSAKKLTEEDAEAGDWWNLAGDIANIGGIPAKNIVRDAVGFVNLIGDTTDDIHTKDAWGAFARGFTGTEKGKSEELYEAIVSGDEGRLEVYRKGYKTSDAYQTAVRKALRENDPRIREAAEAHLNGDVSKRVSIAKQIANERNFSVDDVIKAINAEINALKKEAEESKESTEGSTNESPADEATSYYKADDINIALEDGDTSTAKTIIDDLVKTKVANGKTEKEAKASVKSAITSYWKPLYLANPSDRGRIRKLLKATGLYGSTNDVIKTCKQWEKDDK